MPERWKKRYQPISTIKKNWYNNLEKEISEEEWDTAIKQTKNDSALGPTGITYPLLKNADSYMKRTLIKLANKCMDYEGMPKK